MTIATITQAEKNAVQSSFDTSIHSRKLGEAVVPECCYSTITKPSSKVMGDLKNVNGRGLEDQMVRLNKFHLRGVSDHRETEGKAWILKD